MEETSGEHLGGIHRRFSPLAWKLFARVITNISWSAPRRYHATSLDFLPILDRCGTPFRHLWPHFLRPRRVLGTILGPSWDTLGSRPLKTSKRSLFGTSFSIPFGLTFSLFLHMHFQCIFNTLANHFFHEFGTILAPLFTYMSLLSWKCWIPQKMHTLQWKITICYVLNAQLCLYFETCFNTKSRTHILLIFTRF